eukprot:TRINITY_DN30463_c0_g1_i1.p1 TRINITY_DN30463_c0_g1~~TRINITY_DN30463_c0_g1_i1.p1  ORF type:complete len:126 (+),score=10.54 TRINITY_DN30463_c0_g1_i1:161-538(+)
MLPSAAAQLSGHRHRHTGHHQKAEVHAFVSGKVQGVEYRGHCRDAMRGLGLKGTVVNVPNGLVEVKATGQPKQLKRLCKWLPQGSPTAQVSHVAVSSRYCHTGSGDCHVAGQAGVNGRKRINGHS